MLTRPVAVTARAGSAQVAVAICPARLAGDALVPRTLDGRGGIRALPSGRRRNGRYGSESS